MPQQTSQNTSWQIWIDTGGTFTDCLAQDPEGRLHRAKVLSSSALRGTVVKQLSPTQLRIQEQWSAPTDFIRGFHFRLLSPPSHDLTFTETSLHPTASNPHSVIQRGPCPVNGFNLDECVLELSVPLQIEAGAAFEVLSPEEAPVLAARLVTRTPAGSPLPPIEMRLATTRGTNALLERQGAKTALFITKGLGDLLEIGDQSRPDLFALDIRKPQPLYHTVVEVAERLAADGSVLQPLQAEVLEPALKQLLGEGIETAAIAFMHSYRNKKHEQELEAILRRKGFRHISTSSELAPLIKLLPRAQTAVVDAYLSPIIEEYLDAVQSALPGGRLHVMTSAGGLMAAGEFHPRDSLLSGPAGGVVGAALSAQQSGCARAIAFDMGGTSTDVARYDGDYDYVFEHRVGDAHLTAPALAIESVAAGGGSICAFDGHSLQVGPRSAGADPGPACYGAGGPLTLTDVHLLLGRLQPRWFQIPIHREKASAAFEELLKAVETTSGSPVVSEEMLEGLLRIANERMADAVRHISLRQGYDPAEYTLVAFGGAGGQHACGLAAHLGIRNILAPADAGLLSALGLGYARIERFAEQQVLQRLDQVEDMIPSWIQELGAKAARAVEAEGISPQAVEIRRRIVHLRLLGQDSTIPIDYKEGVSLREAFAASYISIFGHPAEGNPIEVESIRVAASSSASLDPQSPIPGPQSPVRHPGSTISNPQLAIRRLQSSDSAILHPTLVHAYFNGAWVETPVYQREEVLPGKVLQGPAIVHDPHSAIVIEPGWTAEMNASGAILLRAGSQEPSLQSSPVKVPQIPDPPLPQPIPEALSQIQDPGAQIPTTPTSADPLTHLLVERLPQPSTATVTHTPTHPNTPTSTHPHTHTLTHPHSPLHLELFTNRFASIAREMGEMLRRMALSTNIKERLDFSCALLNEAGELVVNAPHIPVHLGALGLCVRQVREALPMEPGDIVVTNHPAYGGSHLPDVTVITPVYFENHLLGYAASRAHHAEIGGSRPGSMPPFATTLAEEGVVIPPTYLARSGEARWDLLREILLSGPYPSRAVEDNLADLRASAAANQRGAAALQKLASEHGAAALHHYMEALERRAEQQIRAALSELPAGSHQALERLDDGSELRVRLDLLGDGARIDFTGSAGVHPGNLNATPAIVRSAVLYVLRLLVKEALPLNEGLMRAVELILPPGMLNPRFPGDPGEAPAVVGGNVETSQRLVDTLLKALDLAACSQGTMNNVLFGNQQFGYYETVCGGCGAGPDFDGASAVHSHMTNTRITDPEILEHRYPVRLERFCIRIGSGGTGLHRGGDGVIRELTFLQPVSLSILSQHRIEVPYGMKGGDPGKPGCQQIRRASGEAVDLGPIDAAELLPGDRLILETPGGGGWGGMEAVG